MNDSFGAALEQLLEDSGRQKQELAELLGKDPRQVTRFVQDQASPDYLQLWQILRFCDANKTQTATVSRAWLTTLVDRDVSKKLPRPDDSRLVDDAEAQAVARELWQLLNGSGVAQAPRAATRAAGEPLPDFAPPYARWIRLSQQLNDMRLRTPSYEALEKAAEAAPDDQRTLALVTAHQAIRRSEMDDLAGAEARVRETHRLLGVAGLRPGSMVSAKHIDYQLAAGDDTELLAFALTAKAMAYICYSQECFAEAEAWSQTFLAASQVLANSTLRAEAEHILGKTLVAKGADIGDAQETERAWRAVRDPEEIKRGLSHLNWAQAVRPVEDRAGRLRDLHQEGKALLLLGDTKGAKRVGDAARELFGQSWTPIEVPLDQARRDLADGSLARTHDHLMEVLDLAWATRSIELQARALIGLGELQLARPTNRQRVIDCCVAAMLAWPFALNQRDFRRMLRLFQRLHATPLEFERSYSSSRPPLDTVIGVTPLNPGRLAGIRNLVKWVSIQP